MIRKLFCLFVICMTLLACQVSGTPAAGPTTDPQIAIQTVVVQTFAAQTQLAQAVQSTLAAMATDTPTLTLTPSLTDTPVFTFTPSLTLTPTFTLTPTTPKLTVSVETNCRSGPGKIYPVLGVLPVGQPADIVGRDQATANYIIQLPSNPSITCWVWTQYASVSGSTAGLTVLTPPPTPTVAANYNLSFAGTEHCGATYAVKFTIVNTGAVTWESAQINATDRTVSASHSVNRNNFPNYSGCVITNADDNLEPGETGVTTSSGFVANPGGHDFSATLHVCSQDNLAGICVDKTITFVP